MKLESNHGSYAFLSKILLFILLCRKNDPERMCGSILTYMYLFNQAIILIRVLWLPGVSKICVSFADKYSCTFVYSLRLLHQLFS